MPTHDYRLCLAPMMGYTDRHCRMLFRLISNGIRVYTEMVTSQALMHGDPERLLGHDAHDAPSALQLGGSDPTELAVAARMAEDYGYQEVNLNVGCPSDRVQQGRIGACLMAEPDLVAAAVDAMRRAVNIPVTVKSRIGIDDRDDYESFIDFIDRVHQGGCTVFIVHARKAMLEGLSPRQNREIPPLRYDYVHRLKKERGNLTIVLNGGLSEPEIVERESAALDGVMLGRAALKRPLLMAELARRIGLTARLEPAEVFDVYCDYMVSQSARGVPLRTMATHLLNLFQGMPGARRFRRHLSETMPNPGFCMNDVMAARALVTPLNAETAPC